MEQNPYDAPQQYAAPEEHEPWPYWNAVAITGFVLAIVSNRVRFAILGEFWGPPTGPFMTEMALCSTAGILIGIIMLVVGGIGWFRTWLRDLD
jgi:hypothetical protein